ncbi:universal stress protein [Paenibacillus sp. MBLB4367]|uniref:universal stress protein n=1 Tax=Paenibacillus sp. MBLB4367 TaxID=3384767 RepID=UPI0039084045
MLLAYDGSPLSKKALQLAIKLAGDSKAKLEAVHVLHNPVAVIGEAIVKPSDEYEKEYLKRVESMVEEANRQLAGLPDAKATLLIGNPVAAILDYAKEMSADVIIVGSRGLSDVKELFLGSVSHNIVQHSPIPVLVVK